MWTGTFQAVMTALIAVAYYAIDFALMARYDRDRPPQKSGRNWRYTLFILAIAAALICQPIIAPGLSLHIQADWAVWIQMFGIALAGLGLTIHVWARVHLGRFYAERVEVIDGHQVIDTGPYAYVRHPVILSFFLIVIGLFLINPALPTALMVIYTYGDFSGAARKEEQKLSRLPGYSDYLLSTPRFFPNVRQVRSHLKKG